MKLVLVLFAVLVAASSVAAQSQPSDDVQAAVTQASKQWFEAFSLEMGRRWTSWNVIVTGVSMNATIKTAGVSIQMRDTILNVSGSREVGIVTAPTNLTVDSNAKPVLQAVFDKGQPFDGQPVLPTLRNLSALVSGVVDTIRGMLTSEASPDRDVLRRCVWFALVLRPDGRIHHIGSDTPGFWLAFADCLAGRFEAVGDDGLRSVSVAVAASDRATDAAGDVLGVM